MMLILAPWALHPTSPKRLRLCAQAHFDSYFDRIAENVLYVEHEPLLTQDPSS